MKTIKSKIVLLTIVTSLCLAFALPQSLSGQAHAAPSTIQHFSQPPFALYKVSNQDTLYFIGKRYGVTVDRLFQLNPGINPYSLQPGQTIKLKDVAVKQPQSQQPSQPVQPATPSLHANIGSFEQQVHVLVNQERAKNGLSPLRLDTKLSAMAKDKAIDMYTNNYFAHNSPKYGSPFEMMDSYGISYSHAGENIARGQRSPQEVMNAWMNSPGHRANILNANFNAIGVAYYNGDWVQAFIRS